MITREVYNVIRQYQSDELMQWLKENNLSYADYREEQWKFSEERTLESTIHEWCRKRFGDTDKAFTTAEKMFTAMIEVLAKAEAVGDRGKPQDTNGDLH